MSATRTTFAATKNMPKTTPTADEGLPPHVLIDRRVAELQDWRGDLLARLRTLIRSADPGVVEEWKWNTPVWSCAGIVCTGETYKKVVKLTFAKGASLADPKRLFNASLDGRTRRAIDFSEAAPLDDEALTALVRAAVALNQSSAAGKPPRTA